jgi:hypothetical protein
LTFDAELPISVNNPENKVIKMLDIPFLGDD